MHCIYSIISHQLLQRAESMMYYPRNDVRRKKLMNTKNRRGSEILGMAATLLLQKKTDPAAFIAVDENR